MNKKHLIEITIFLTYALFAMSWVAGSMMTTDIMSYYNIDGMAAATWMTNAITIAKIIGNLAAAWLLVKMGPKKAFAVASLLIVAGAIGAFASNYPSYVFSRLVMGFGGAFAIVYFNPIVIKYFSAEERPLINGINAAAFNMGNLLALLFTGSMLASLGSWQNVILAISAISLAILIVWWFISDDFSLSSTADNKEQAAYTLKDGMKESVNWWLPIAYSGLLFCYISVFALFPLVPSFAAEAKYLSSIMIGAGMVGTIAGIIAAKRYPLRVPVIRYCGLAMTAFAALMITTGSATIAYGAAFMAGFFMFVPMTSLVTLPQELPNMTPGRITVIFGMFWSISYTIETVLMYFAGVIADTTGNIAYAATFAVICSSTFFLASFFLPETGKKTEVINATTKNA
ncbi:MFS transporter [Vibrio cholerae]|uniref:MFS transporter n=1 Tax=Vibrio TaxID=662 RepID=UPI0015CF159E|nr:MULTISPECIES: MFS transporter [Vibrio]ELV8684182.1 MFS transporter [Vibrio fluvialis]MCG6231753.1 MFS transporter [Vibrio furnissii]MCG6258841.1 MFS transporter [Vibrio furnissii]MCO7013400.1 MFS transporter [Vibrio paracholerae]MCO7033553.1 MFS transporter [Vibrio paracholerae]